MIGSRQYSRDLRVETRRPEPPRNLSYDQDTMELSWTAPIRGPQFTHFNIRLDDDTAAPAFRVPAGTTRLLIARAAKVIVSCWNETVQTESYPARLAVGDPSSWNGATSSILGPMLFYRVRYNLTSTFTLTSPVESRENRRLLLTIFQHATVRYQPAFDPADFVDSPNVFIDLAWAWTREFCGNADGKWYPIGPGYAYDPTI